ncbi:hypothetical protein J19TS2_51350 [Cohnella xylanilytica]|uniref:Copper amine oxidase n=1 Tax=Cohnella xylanilytica TaxID=557555 RepID=A0A841U4M1_9BACL|nr:copper amine oxidase [Cohnella xylanilytica]MBB6693031.1 copper amine oxidase [Cohnella xylanilytica]GIO15580.1 hypothetical protein J19TS2_51350 [Cohnella xylanilytica]
MKIRKLVVLTVALTLVGGSAIFAADTVSQKVKIILNKQELDDAGTIVDGKAYVGVRSLGDVVQGFVSWDDSAKKVTIYKPNVHMFLMTGNKPFGSVQKGKNSFRVFAQIDNLQTSISSFKVTIADPYGDETWIDGRTSKDADFPTDKDNFWFTSEDLSYEFKYSGKYTIRFWMKPSDNSPLQVVSEKTIVSK